MIWILPILLFLTSCSCLSFLGLGSSGGGGYQTYVQQVNPTAFSEVIIPYAAELTETKRLRFEDSKVYYNEFAERFRVIFSSQVILELCEARDLMVTVVEELLDRMNESPGVVENFDHFPITADDLELYFSFESYDIEFNDGTYICWMSLHDGLVRYYTGLLKNHRNDYWDARIEPYYKSLEFVQITRAAGESLLRKKHMGKSSLESHVFEL